MGSFRQLLLVAFLLIAALLGGTALRAVVILDRLMSQSAAEAVGALELSGAAHTLTARTAAMERAARQSLVLNDAVLQQRYDEESRAARAALERMAANGVADADLGAWRERTAAIGRLLGGPVATALDRERTVAGEFRELDAVNNRITGAVQGLIEERNRELGTQLAASRARLMQQVLAAIAFTMLLAIGLGVWLARPFRRLGRAIVALGENRLHEPVAIRGPADVRAVGQQLEWLRLRLTELDADKARFLRHVSHELKTPLAALREGVALLQEGVTGQLNAGQREVVDILHQNTRSLQAQIEALLRFNAAAFEARQLRRRKTDLLALLRDCVEAQRLQWQGRRLAVQVDGPPVALAVDPDKLGAAVANLLSNAIRFSPEGGTVQLRLATQPERVCIDIEDQGPGVAPQDRERIFEPFYRGGRQPDHALRGTGVGLSIVQEYITAHGGRVGLLSDSPGAHFRIELPHASS
ncbi:ATP-binding protein [Ramlibacter sp.]|uniref:ATP-binding protein n=1 Tax=Ramlibacter sp. TaxID=1917967 RepID=UPI002C56821B|nr:ATP-binding protein [Ramlibacter sp.]HWI80602.1 ATP-binding protein [Ramlibacter sp.]